MSQRKILAIIWGLSLVLGPLGVFLGHQVEPGVTGIALGLALTAAAMVIGSAVVAVVGTVVSAARNESADRSHRSE